MSAWHKTPETIDYLDRLDRKSLWIRMDKPCVGPDRLIWTGEPVEVLEGIRERHLEALLGPFSVAHHKGRMAAMAWIEAADVYPSVQQVLNERFGKPDRWRGHGADKARAMFLRQPHAFRGELVE